MLTVADQAQQGFFDASWCGDLLAKDSIYSLLAEHGERIVRDEDFADCYAERSDRPSIPPSLLAKTLLLAYRDGLSDERAMEALRFDLRWKVALDLPIDHPGFHSTSLVRFRARLLLHGKERLLASESERSKTTEQIVDSTPMLGAAAVQDTVSLVRSGVRKLIDAVRGADSEAAEGLESGLRFDYARPREKPEGDWHDKAAREALLGEIAKDAERALRAVEQEDDLLGDEAIAASAALLREIVGQEFEASGEEVLRLRRGRGTRQVLSAHDPEMRHGRKTAAKPFTGYKLHAAADAEVPLLTSICVSPGSEHDGQHAKTLIEEQPEERRPQRVIGDTAYGNIEAREALEQRSVEVLAPSTPPRPRTGRSPRRPSRSTSRQARSPARGARRRTCRSPTRAASGSRRPPGAHCGRSGHGPQAFGRKRDASVAARIFARRRCVRYRTPRRASSSSGSGPGSSGCSD